MREIVKKFNVYKFQELSDKAKEKALEKMYEINIDNDWWDFLYEGFKEELHEVGLDCDTFYFSLDRDYHITPEKLRFTDLKLFIKKLVLFRLDYNNIKLIGKIIK
jgi:hypothetical protein